MQDVNRLSPSLIGFAFFVSTFSSLAFAPFLTCIQSATARVIAGSDMNPLILVYRIEKKS